MSIWRKQKRVYLDAAAAAPVSLRASRAFRCAQEVYGNPSSPHAEGRLASAMLEQSRVRVAALAEVKPDAVVFTANATEANGLLISGHIKALHVDGRMHKDMHVLYDAGAHSSLVESVLDLAARGVQTEALVYRNGEIDLDAFKKQLTPHTVLVAVSAVCSETGAITPVREIKRVLVLKHRTGDIVLHADACQLPRVGAFELTRLGADSLVLGAQKVGGVRGIGVLIAPRRVPISPIVIGGGQERGLRSGTQVPALAHAFAEALAEVHENRGEFLERATSLRAALLSEMATIPRAIVNEGKHQAPHIVNVSFIGRDTDYLVALLDTAGFAVATRSACETDAEGPRAVYEMTGSKERAQSTIRISWGPNVTMREIEAFSSALTRSVKFLDTAGIL